ncbi:MAG: hypothetical protein IJN43_09000 [Ruminococcus sp.]|nr:hypothetical protein [Ruminococcus sp.]
MQHNIYLRRIGVSVPCTDEEFKEYYRGINTFRRKEQRHGRCACPANQRFACDMVCGHCPHIRTGDMLSLEEVIFEDEGVQYLDIVTEESRLFDEMIIEAEALKVILKRIEELMPIAILIGQLRIAGYTETEIEQLLHIGRRTYAYRLKKLRGIIEKEFSEIMQDFFPNP